MVKFSFFEKATKIWRNRPQGFDITTLRTIASNFCGLFRKAEVKRKLAVIVFSVYYMARLSWYRLAK